ncbi:GPI anchored protein [Ophiocordyceps camponoti-floridani]|uniref:GPI anchored protein n=1 Tax=Ophiocordyceps camponoti-floridani TaxID=2030778 RepID=A0A8H4Q3E6_9HYPO|nr:GPI anchored protein [Ophiocordyceps camponoti-floridani]
MSSLPTALRKLPPLAEAKLHAQDLSFASPLLLIVAAAAAANQPSCPQGMTSCAAQNAPQKCCPRGSYCTDVPDARVGGVACCPEGARCGGGGLLSGWGGGLSGRDGGDAALPGSCVGGWDV